MSDESSWYQLNVTYPAISAMYQTKNYESNPVGIRSTYSLSILNEDIETGMSMSNFHSRIVKSVKINKE